MARSSHASGNSTIDAGPMATRLALSITIAVWAPSDEACSRRLGPSSLSACGKAGMADGPSDGVGHMIDDVGR